jgi:type I restriction enzyme M protein
VDFTPCCLTRTDVNLDISWLRDESLQSADDLPEPGVIALRIMERLETAMEEMAALKDLLS